MPKIEIKIKTWVCPSCGYHQDFDPGNAELMKKHFPKVFVLYEIEGTPVETGTFDEDGKPIMEIPITYTKEVGFCPACFLGQCPDKKRKKTKMVKETDPKKKTTLTVMGEDEVEALEIETGELDTEGKPINRKLTKDEKDAKKVEIQEAIVRARELEDK